MIKRYTFKALSGWEEEPKGQAVMYFDHIKALEEAKQQLKEVYAESDRCKAGWEQAEKELEAAKGKYDDEVRCGEAVLKKINEMYGKLEKELEEAKRSSAANADHAKLANENLALVTKCNKSNRERAEKAESKVAALVGCFQWCIDNYDPTAPEVACHKIKDTLANIDKPDGEQLAQSEDVNRMDWLVSMNVEVRKPALYGSHKLFTAQTISDEEDEQHHTSLREQIDEERKNLSGEQVNPLLENTLANGVVPMELACPEQVEQEQESDNDE